MWRRRRGRGWGGGGGGSGQHLGSRYVFSHVKEVVVAAHVLGEERECWRMPAKLSNTLIITIIRLSKAGELRLRWPEQTEEEPEELESVRDQRRCTDSQIHLQNQRPHLFYRRRRRGRGNRRAPYLK